jgi:hypothetical protein
MGNSNLAETNLLEIRRQDLPHKKLEISRTCGIEYFDNLEVQPLKTPNSKTQQVFHTKSIFDELALVIRINTSPKESHG